MVFCVSLFAMPCRKLKAQSVLSCSGFPCSRGPASLSFPEDSSRHPKAEPDLRLVGLSNKKESCSQVEAKPGRGIKAKGAKEFPVLPLPKHFPGCTVVSFLSPETACSLKAGSLSPWFFTV